jgi:hypothetical protein
MDWGANGASTMTECYRKIYMSVDKLCDSNNAIEQTSLLFTEPDGGTKERADSCIKIR